jgi:hypothetical protein
MSLDGIKWSPRAHIAKYNPDVVRELTEYLGYEPQAADYERLSIRPNDETEVIGNLLTTAGLNRITNLIIGEGSLQAFDDSHAVVGVGNSTTAAAVGNTALGADGGSAWYQAAGGGVSASNGTITAISTFASGDANFAWEEWCWVVVTGTITASNTLASVGSTSEQMLNRKVASMGTKASGASWVFTTTVTLS